MPRHAVEPRRPGGGAVEDLIELPDGFQPEGIAIDPRGTAYFGSLADGDIYAADLRTGEGEIIAEGRARRRSASRSTSGAGSSSPGAAGEARVVDADR